MDNKADEERIRYLDGLVRDILESDRMKNGKAFADRVFTDEPILRRGPRPAGNEVRAREAAQEKRNPFVAPPLPPRVPMSSKYRRMRALERRSRGSSTSMRSTAELFYRQGKLMEDFEEDFEGTAQFTGAIPTYRAMSDYQLRCYFTWRTRLRAGEAPEAPVAFLYLNTYELLCGIGAEPGVEAYRKMDELRQHYTGAYASFDAHLTRWIHDYVIFYGLPRSLLTVVHKQGFPESVALVRKAEQQLIRLGAQSWPQAPQDGLPTPEDLLDALCTVSRYRAERSRFFKDNRADVARVVANVFACMVAHCHKRRKIDFVEGLFGPPSRISYIMFPSAVMWVPFVHKDDVYVAGPTETYRCEHGFWWRDLPCRRMETSREVGALLHAIDSRMRLAAGDAHPLKEKSLPKYQQKFVDQQIELLQEQKRAEEAAHISIDRSALGAIRSASLRTQEALLTDEERQDEDQGDAPMPKAPDLSPAPREDAPGQEQPVLPEEAAEKEPGLTDLQLQLLSALLTGKEVPAEASATLLLQVDAINEYFMEVLGDVVIELDGDEPCLVEDYTEDVSQILEEKNF